MFSQQLFSLEPDSAPLLCGLIPAHPWGPCCSPQKDRGLPTIKKTPQSFLCIAGGASLQPVSSRNTKEKVQFLPLKTQRCVNQPFPPDQTQLPAQTLLHPKPHVNQSSASSMQAPHPGHLGFPSIQSQSSPQILPDPLNCAVIRPRMTQISPNSAHDLSEPPVLAQNTSFITTARPTPTPAAQVRPVARAVAGAVARGMPGAGRDGACARVAPEPELTGKSQGQEVKEDPHSSQSLLCEEKKEEMEEETKECGVGDDDKDTPCQSKAGEDEDGVTVWYQLQLQKQKRLREKLNLQKEKRRHMQAQNRWKQRQEKLQNVPPTLSEKKEKDDGMSVWVPAQANKGSRVVTFTRTQSYGRDTFRQLNSHQPVKL
ncbi:RNA-binding protein 33-like [Hoplias malabaricus]|uniref:RNA-binding protein 33-like n=1 Tax=Hoplias malabaricus TaxID=27720 RepID=UPI0034624811